VGKRNPTGGFLKSFNAQLAIAGFLAVILAIPALAQAQKPKGQGKRARAAAAGQNPQKPADGARAGRAGGRRGGAGQRTTPPAEDKAKRPPRSDRPGPPLTVTAEREGAYSLEIARETSGPEVLFPLTLESLVDTIVREAEGYLLADRPVTTRPLRFLCGPNEPFARVARVLIALEERRPAFRGVALVTSRGERAFEIPIFDSEGAREAAASRKRLILRAEGGSDRDLLFRSSEADVDFRIEPGGAIPRADFVSGLRAILRGSREIRECVVTASPDSTCGAVAVALDVVAEFGGKAPYLAVAANGMQAAGGASRPGSDVLPADVVLAAERDAPLCTVSARVLEGEQPRYLSAVVPDARSEKAAADGAVVFPPAAADGRGPRLLPGSGSSAVEDALLFLAAVQREDGGWGALSGSGPAELASVATEELIQDYGRTGVCTLAFLQSGFAGSPRFVDIVNSGLDRLGRLTLELGRRFRPTGTSARSHSPDEASIREILIGAASLLEGLARSSDPYRRAHGEAALGLVLAFQKSDGSWGSVRTPDGASGTPSPPSGAGSAVATAWATAGLHGAERAGLTYPRTGLTRLRQWLAATPLPGIPGEDAPLLFARLLADESYLRSGGSSEVTTRLGAQAGPPRAEGLAVLETLQFRLAAAFQGSGETFFEVRDLARDTVLTERRIEGPFAGSLGGNGVGFDERLRRTALSVLVLASAERYDRFAALR